jgi:nicotinate-nucleotide pyrophosphorylase (carboxylating)
MAADDIRYRIFESCLTWRVKAVLVAEQGGVISGLEQARRSMKSLGVRFSSVLRDGDAVGIGQEVAQIEGDPVCVVQAEERIIGDLSKPSGIATAASRAREAVGSRCQVVSGGWKKMPPAMKEAVRRAVHAGGMRSRIMEEPFVYLDKNYVRILGGVARAVRAVSGLQRPIVVQVRGETAPVGEEGLAAARAGAKVVMVDTGRPEDADEVIRSLDVHGFRSRVQVAFAGNLRVDGLERLTAIGLDLLDIGYAVVDAPCLPMRLDVIHAAPEERA